MNRVRLVTFDVTNCLLGQRRSLNDTYAEVAAKHGVHLQQQQHQQLFTAFKKSYRDIDTRFPCFGINHGLSSREWWLQVTDGTFRRVGVVGETKRLNYIFNELFARYETTSEWALDEGAPYILPELYHHGLKLGVITNFDSRVLKLLKLFGLANWLHFTVTSQEARFAKPNREIFDKAAKKAARFFDLDDAKMREQWIHVGSDWKTDIFGAKNAGIEHAILYSCGPPEPKPDELASMQGVSEVKHLSDVHHLLFSQQKSDHLFREPYSSEV